MCMFGTECRLGFVVSVIGSSIFLDHIRFIRCRKFGRSAAGTGSKIASSAKVEQVISNGSSMHRGGISLSEMTGNGLLILANEFDEEVVSEPDEMEDSDADDDRRS